MQVLTLFFLTGCGKFPFLGNQESPENSVRCFMNAYYGLIISVKSNSNQSLEGAKLVVQDGDWKEEFDWKEEYEFKRPGPGYQYFLTDDHIWMAVTAAERPGNYQITLTHPKVSQSVQKTEKVTKNECHVNPQTVHFEIE